MRRSGQVKVHASPVALLGAGIVALLGLAAAAASATGSPVRAGAPELGDAPSSVFLAAVCCAFGVYVLALVVLHRRSGSLAAVCAVAAAIQLVPLAGPLVLSRDVYAYWAYGRLVEDHGANPYRTVPAHFATDPAERAMARPRCGLATILLLCASPWLLPWYAVWVVPLAAIENDGAAWILALAFSAYLLPDRVPL